jgi:hypothetical protein
MLSRLVVLAAVAVGISACFVDGASDVNGRVCDVLGRPLENVRIQIRAPYGAGGAPDGRTVSEVLSRSDGCFDVGGTHKSGRLQLELQASKDGFRTYVGNFRSGYYVNNVTLVPNNSSRASFGQFIPHSFQRDGRAPCQE